MKPLLIAYLVMSICFKMDNLNASEVDQFDSNDEEQIANSNQIDLIIRKIPEWDLIKIKSLFENLFKFNELGFTLFGDKPVSFCTLTKVEADNFSSCDDICLYSRRILQPTKNYQEAWSAWQKHKHLFPINNFILLNGDLGVLLINRKEFSKVVSNHLALFEDALQKEFDIDIFLNELQEGKNLFDLLASNHELLGIVLGFGCHNSKLFQRRAEILSILEPYKIPPDLRNRILPSSKHLSSQDELKSLWQTLRPLNNYDIYFPLTDLNRVTFVVDLDDKETKFLRNKYEEQRKKIKNILSKENWFEQIILQLISKNSYVID